MVQSKYTFIQKVLTVLLSVVILTKCAHQRNLLSAKNNLIALGNRPHVGLEKDHLLGKAKLNHFWHIKAKLIF